MTTTDDLLTLLEESEVPADDELRTLLADLQALGAGPVPAPAPELAALLVQQGRGGRRLHRRGALIGALVVLSLGTGVTAAAASPDVRDGAAGAVAAVVHVLRPPAAGSPSIPAPAVQHAAPAARIPATSAPTHSDSVTVPAAPARHSPAPGATDRGSRVADDARHDGGPSDDRRHGTSGTSGSSDSHDGTSTGSGSSTGSGRDSSGGSDGGSDGGSSGGSSGSSGTDDGGGGSAQGSGGSDGGSGGDD